MLKKILDKVDQFMAKVVNKVVESEAVREERGDTNFISILIVLGIVILLATVFMGFKNQIVSQVQSIIDGFTIG